tara:strand:- start:869 stop:1975 length:1107 start_codon:yes stop_codon:yes gene_type:complete
MADLILDFNLKDSALGHLTTAVQLGFILGTLLFAILSIADRFSPSKVFFVCALFGALFNLGLVWEGNSLFSILPLRFLTGFFLAGIYPVGMKIAADYYEKGLGKSLGFLVGALVLGTAFPHLAKEVSHNFAWQLVLIVTSLLAVIGGLLMFLGVPDGPFRKTGTRIDFSAFFGVFRNTNFRSAAMGYFGHMWELYAFWAFVPVILKTYGTLHPAVELDIPLLSFSIIGVGALACVLAGYLAQNFGTKRIASLALFLSCACCFLSPLIFAIEEKSLLIAFLLFWGMVVIADSPLFSTLVANNAHSEIKATALTIVNSIGFFLTIISIQLISYLLEVSNPIYVYTILGLGPILGLIAIWDKKKTVVESTN